jgi:hypothetical protein
MARQNQGRGSFDQGRSGGRDRDRPSRSRHESGYGGGRESSPDWESQRYGGGSFGEGGRQGGYEQGGFGGPSGAGFGGGTSTFGGQQQGYGGYRGGESQGGYQGGQGSQYGSQQWSGQQGGFGGGRGQQQGWGTAQGPQGGWGSPSSGEWNYGGQGGLGREESGYGGGAYGGGYGISYAGRGPKGYRRSDERIKEDVSDRLEQHPHIDAIDVEVSVSGGTVTLSGTVPERQMKRLAEDLVEGCPGVKEVTNQLRVARLDEQGQQGQQQTPTERSSSTNKR